MNRRGYNKFLEISKDIQVYISEERISNDEKWDGLKGYTTNTDLDAEKVADQYHGLWVVEKAFRVSKGTLDMRPMFHFTERRIEAHVCICFVAYKVYKELERIIKLAGINMSISGSTQNSKNDHHCKSEHAREQGRVCQDAIPNKASEGYRTALQTIKLGA